MTMGTPIPIPTPSPIFSAVDVSLITVDTAGAPLDPPVVDVRAAVLGILFANVADLLAAPATSFGSLVMFTFGLISSKLFPLPTCNVYTGREEVLKRPLLSS